MMRRFLLVLVLIALLSACGRERPSEEIVRTVPEPTATAEAPAAWSSRRAEPQSDTYILNTNTKKFHRPDCSSVSQMKDANKREFTGSRYDVIEMGYAPCQRCKP